MSLQSSSAAVAGSFSLPIFNSLTAPRHDLQKRQASRADIAEASAEFVDTIFKAASYFPTCAALISTKYVTVPECRNVDPAGDKAIEECGLDERAILGGDWSSVKCACEAIGKTDVASSDKCFEKLCDDDEAGEKQAKEGVRKMVKESADACWKWYEVGSGKTQIESEKPPSSGVKIGASMGLLILGAIVAPLLAL